MTEILLAASIIFLIVDIFLQHRQNKTPKSPQKEPTINKQPPDTIALKRLNTLLYNIDIYDGTDKGQKEVV